ncbi:MAG: amidohydrolase family protein [Ilumatobacteraceae bacterium]
MTQMTPSSVVIGSVLQAPSASVLQHLPDVAVVIDGAGLIVAIHPVGSPEADAACAGAIDIVRLRPAQRLLPGLIDLHVHAPQWPQLGTGLDLPLEQWLFENTFPLEARFADATFAQEVWDDMVPTLLAHGTTTAVYFSSIHDDATERLAATCSRLGQRAFVGRVAMDHPESTPPWYRDPSAAKGVAASARSLAAIAALGDPLVQPIITPRFVPACTDELLVGLGELAARSGVRVQTHCSESDWEHASVFDRFGRTDAVVLRGFGLLRDHTVLAHGDHLGDDDLAVVRAAGSGVAHCPLSNSYFANAVFPAARAMALGVRVGLGTDIAGGSHPGLLPQCAMAVTVSRLLDDGVDAATPAADRGVPGSRIDTVAAFHLATVGGAEVLGIPCGLIEVGRSFDAFVVDLDGDHRGALRVWDDIDDESRVFEKIVRLAGLSDISRVWVAGRVVSGS